jgi:hypothetical protein
MPHPSPDRAYRWHKDNTKSGYIHRRCTFSPTNISPVLQMMDIQVVWGDKTGGSDIYYQFIFENHVYYRYFCHGIVRFFIHSTFD